MITWSPEAFTWYLYESPLAPQNLVANGGIQSASLEWQAYDIPEQEAVNRFNQPQKKLEFQSESYLQKKSQIRTDDSDTRNTFWVNSDYSSGSRSTAVTIECDGGVYQSEVSWDLLDANGSVIASGGAPALLEIELANGSYTLNAYDSWGDGWNGNYFHVYSETQHLCIGP